MSGQTYEINSPDVITENFDDDLVLLNLRSGEYFNFTGRSRKFLDALVSGVNPAELLSELSKQEPDAGIDAVDLFEKIQKHKLIRPTVGVAATTSATMHAQAVLTMDTPFYFECFTDLGDLIAADPIHDVATEAGWPIMPETT